MEGIDWERYAHLCDDSTEPAIGRFEGTLRKAAGVATNQSIAVYAGAMKGSLVTSLRTMTDILKEFAQSQLSETEQRKINWKKVEDRMREAYFDRLSRVDNLVIASEYVRTRIQNRSAEPEQVYRWVSSFRNPDVQIRRLVGSIREANALFVRVDVPQIMDVALLTGRSLR